MFLAFISVRLIVAIAVGAMAAGGGSYVAYSLANSQPDSAVTYSYPGS